MKEIEAKFLDIDISKIRKKIKLSGGIKIHKMMLYRRYVFNLLNKQNGYIRIREENEKVKMTVKTYSDDSKFADEYEIEISSTLEDAKKFLLILGYKLKHYHETLREKWSLGQCYEVAIDIIPGIPPYLELECKNEKAIQKVANILELNINDAVYEAYWKRYVEYYGVDKDDINIIIPSLTFSRIDKELKNYVKFNYDNLKKEKKLQLEFIKKNKIHIAQ